MIVPDANLRLMTHPQICENPLSIAQVREIALGWLVYPQVRLLSPSGRRDRASRIA